MKKLGYHCHDLDENDRLIQPKDRATKLVAEAKRYSISSAGVFRDQERWRHGERAFRFDKINQLAAPKKLKQIDDALEVYWTTSFAPEDLDEETLDEMIETAKKLAKLERKTLKAAKKGKK